MINNSIDILDNFIKLYVKPMVNESTNSIRIDFQELEDSFNENGYGEALETNKLKFLSAISEKTGKRIILENHPITTELKNLKSSNIGEIVCIEGVIKSMTDIHPEDYNVTYLCKNCLNKYKSTIKQLSLENNLNYPERCENCGGKGKFEKIESETESIDVLNFSIEEPFENRTGGIPRKFNCIVKDEIATHEKNHQPGDKVKITGLFKKMYIKRARDEKQIFIIDVLNIETLKTSYKTIEISKDDEEEIKELASKQDIIKLLKNSILPSIIGRDNVKEGILCQLFSEWGSEKKREIIHVLLVGDPGTGKSQIIQQLKQLNLKSAETVGGATTEAGILGTALRDEISGQWRIEAGLFPMCDDGLVAIDEFDKSSHKLYSKMNEPMEQGTVTITKVSQNITFPAKVQVLAAMNPTKGYLDECKSLREQIKLPETVLDRFDLIYILQDIPNELDDMGLAYSLTSPRLTDSDLISEEILQKYVCYAKREIHPELNTQAKKILTEFYVELRKDQDNVKQISTRDFEALYRITKSLARINLQQEASETHAREAINIYKESLKTFNLASRSSKTPIMEEIDLTQ